MFESYRTDQICPIGGIGRHTGFRNQRRKAWRFKSVIGHQFGVATRFPEATRHPERGVATPLLFVTPGTLWLRLEVRITKPDLTRKQNKMAIRHMLALHAGDSSDLLELGEILTGAVKEVMEEGNCPPFKDPAVRLICFQIAFAGNGDIQFYPYYADIYNFCVAQVGRDQQGIPIKEKLNEPKYEPS